MTTPKPSRTLPPRDPETGLVPVPPDRSFRRCSCSHPAWRVEGSDPAEWECACPLRGPGACHPPRQVATTDGSLELRWVRHRFRDGGPTAPPIELDWAAMGLADPNAP